MMAPPRLASELHSLPPMLHMMNSGPVPSCSKAPRGLFVLSRVTRICTGISISPSPSLRQRPSRYTFRAGRNLPDKEFRYLRTVIVTAAVHWGFSSVLAHLSLTFQHWAGISPYTSAFALAETYVFVKQSLGPILCRLIEIRHPLSQSYGVRLPSSLARVLSITLGLLPLPTRVGLRYGRYCFKDNEAFLGGIGSVRSPRISPQLSSTFSYSIRGGFACPGITWGKGHTMSIRYARPALPRPSFVSTITVRE
jgi:hypothetical protein